MPVSDEVDPLDAGRPVRDTRARKERVHPSTTFLHGGVDRRPLGEVHVDRLHRFERYLGEVHDDDVGAGVPHELRRRGPHAGRAPNDEHTLPVVTKRIEQRHAGGLNRIAVECKSLRSRIILEPARQLRPPFRKRRPGDSPGISFMTSSPRRCGSAARLDRSHRPHCGSAPPRDPLASGTACARPEL